ncbi:MAG: hypothetical protein KDA89_10410, partial [Planctomycetaceae bacterium]|nr:hypothetical protein [Planctomycetaceae bacterium]
SYLTRIRLSDGQRTHEPLRVGSNGAAMEWLNGYIIIASRGDDSVYSVDPVSWQVTSQVAGIAEPVTLGVLPNGRILAGSLFQPTVELTLLGDRLLRNSETSANVFPYHLTVDSERKLIFLNGFVSRTIHILDAETLQPVQDIPVAGIPSYGGTLWRDAYVGTDRHGYLHLVNRDTLSHRSVDLAELMGLDRSALPEAGIDPTAVIPIDDTHLFVVQSRRHSVLLRFDPSESTFHVVLEGPSAVRGIWQPQTRDLVLVTLRDIQRLRLDEEVSTAEFRETVASERTAVSGSVLHTNDGRILLTLYSDGTADLIPEDAAFPSGIDNRMELKLPTDTSLIVSVSESAGHAEGYVLLQDDVSGSSWLAKVNPDGEVLRTAELNLRLPHSLAVTGDRVAVVDRLHSEVELIDVSDGTQRVYTLSHYRARAAAFLGNGDLVVVHDTNPDIGVSVIRGDTVQFYAQPYARWLSAVAAIDNDRAALLCFNGTIRIFNSRTGLVERTIALPFDRPTDIKVVGPRLAVASPSRGLIAIVDPDTGRSDVWSAPSVTTLVANESTIGIIDPFRITRLAAW